MTRRRTSTISPMSSSPPWAPTALALAFLVDAYDEEVVDAEKNDMRTVMRFHPALAPFKCAVLPLSKKLSGNAQEVTRSCPRTSWWTSTTPAPSASATAVRTRSALPSVRHRGLPDRGQRDRGGRPLRHRPRPGYHGAGADAHLRAESLYRGEDGVLRSFARPPADRRCGGLVLSFDPVRLPGGAFVVCCARRTGRRPAGAPLSFP